MLQQRYPKQWSAIQLAAVCCLLWGSPLQAQDPGCATGCKGPDCPHHFYWKHALGPFGRNCDCDVPCGTDCSCPPQGPFFGYFPTCWHRWPLGYENCPVTDWEHGVPYGAVPGHVIGEEVLGHPVHPADPAHQHLPISPPIRKTEPTPAVGDGPQAPMPPASDGAQSPRRSLIRQTVQLLPALAPSKRLAANSSPLPVQPTTQTVPAPRQVVGSLAATKPSKIPTRRAAKAPVVGVAPSAAEKMRGTLASATEAVEDLEGEDGSVEFVQEEDVETWSAQPASRLLANPLREAAETDLQ